MTELLRTELTRLADDAAPVVVPPAVWRRGRRARLRDRVVSAAAVCLALALAGGGAWLLRPAHRAPEITDTRSAVGVPSHIWAVPERVLDAWDPDVRVGQSAAAYVTERGEVVTVSASDGSYHQLHLPRLQGELWNRTKGMMSSGTWAALSPDGRMLAYSWEATGDAVSFPQQAPDSPVPTGISVMDLVAGKERLVVDAHGGAGILIQDLTWSPDGRWLAWSGLQMTEWTSSRRAGGPAAYGRVRVSDGAHDQAIIRQGVVNGVLVGNEGLLRLLGTKRRTHAADWAVPTPGHPSGGGWRNALSPSGSLVLFDAPSPSGSLEVMQTTDRSVRQIDVSAESFPEGMTARALGWLDDTHPVAELVRVEDHRTGEGWTWGRRQLAVLDTASGAVRLVGEIQSTTEDGSGINDLTIAADLMTVDRPTVDRPAPSWPWSTERKLLVWGLALGVLLLLLALTRGWRPWPWRPRLSPRPRR